MKIHRMPRDFNCLFRALAHFVHGTADLYWDLRDVLLRFISEKPELYYSIHPEGNAASFERYLQQARAGEVQEPEVELAAFG